jgi:CelD/BcsL family acetyltransferase involved in cellulose biosynthesis
VTSVRVLRASDLTPELERVWAEIHREEPLFESPFFHPEFIHLVSSARDDVHVAVLEDGGDPVGFFPFQRDRRGVGYAVGWGLNDYQGVIVRRDVAWTASELIRDCGLRWFEFDHVPAGQQQFAPHRRALGASPVIELGDGFERYERRQREAGSKTLQRLRSRWRRLERDHGPARFEADVGDSELLATLMRWKSAQYRSTGVTDVLALPWFRATVEGAFRASADGFSAPLSVLWAGERPVAMHLGLRSRSVWHYWLPAHDHDPELARTSPGMLMILAMAEHADSFGVRAIDFGKGKVRYKLEFANAEVPLIAGWASRPSMTAARQRLLRGARMLVRRSGLGRRLRRSSGFRSSYPTATGRDRRSGA